MNKVFGKFSSALSRMYIQVDIWQEVEDKKRFIGCEAKI